ncbi:MAG: MBL fold metallo-hydrolase [Deltaproteobacteria bacterium]|nr:MBL fold metallo-hydrolase [Deltaproteobacteria bacterium]
MNYNPLIRQLFDKETSTYTYLVTDPKTNRGVLIDPVLEQAQRDLTLIKELEIDLRYILESHVHADHITAAGVIRNQTGAQIVFGEPAKVSCADIPLKDGDTLSFGELQIKALATPGHTDGCTSYLINGSVYTGDALLIRGCGRTDFQQGSAETLYRSVHDKLFKLDDQTCVYPAHDYLGRCSSTIGEEKKFNPRLGGGKTIDEFIKIMNELNLAKPKRIDEAVPANLKCGL